ncbi:unnamed protein product [Boreogadus saida]
MYLLTQPNTTTTTQTPPYSSEKYPLKQPNTITTSQTPPYSTDKYPLKQPYTTTTPHQCTKNTNPCAPPSPTHHPTHTPTTTSLPVWVQPPSCPAIDPLDIQIHHRTDSLVYLWWHTFCFYTVLLSLASATQRCAAVCVVLQGAARGARRHRHGKERPDLTARDSDLIHQTLRKRPINFPNCPANTQQPTPTQRPKHSQSLLTNLSQHSPVGCLCLERLCAITFTMRGCVLLCEATRLSLVDKAFIV